MRKFYFLVLILLCSAGAYAQKFSIRGQVMDSVSGSLPSSTVMLLNPKDSSLVNFGVSDAKGIFEIKNVNKGEYLLKVTFVGYAPNMRRVATGTEPIVELGRIKMEPLTKELEGVVIMGEKNPVTVKKDTIEFNAGSFKTKTNATVEDLLKVMPGMEVETDGTVKAQGEQVQRVTVDGREFFGRDPKLATRNLPADAIEKVQVFDRKSDNAQFTGIDDGQREKTINLELKEEKRGGAFGNIMGGYGSNDRFQGTASVNKFSKGKQLSFLGMGNNINEQGFSIGDFMNFSGGTQSGGGGSFTVNSGGGGSGGSPSVNFGGRQSGLMTSYAGGLNFNRDLNKDTKLTSSYFYNHLDRNVNTDLSRTNFVPIDPNKPDVDLSNSLTQNSRQISGNDNHRGTLMIDHNIDSANTIKTTATANYTESDQRTFSGSETRSLTDNTLQNTSERTTYTEQQALSLNASTLWRHRFEKKGRTLATNLSVGLNNTNSDGNQQSTNTYYVNTPGEQQIEQTNTQSTTNQSYGASLSYTEPLGGRKYLEANYNFQTNRNDVDREVYNVGGGQPVFDAQLSNKYISNYIYNRPGLNFRMNREKFSVTAGTSYQMTSLKGDLILKDVKIDRTFENLLPSAHFNYDFSSTKHLRIDYETNMQEPTIQQLQPVIDNSDPLNIYVGNPELKPAYAHRISTNFTSFNPARFINFFAFINGSFTNNAIVNSQTVSDKFVRVTVPVNVSSSQSLRANFNVGFPVKKLNSRFNIGPTATLSESITVLNEQNNHVNNRTLGGTARYNFTYKEIVILDLSSNLSQQETKYDFNTPDQQYFNQTYKSEINISFLKNYSFNTSYEHLIYTSKTTDFRQEIPFLDISISRFILKNKAGELKFKVNNLLDQSNSVSQSSGDNYIQQSTTNNPGRFYMVSFTYALNKHLNPMGGGNRRGGGGMRMIIQN